MSEPLSLPGTVHLVDLEGNLAVKKGSDSEKDIILLPPPSKNNPNDPLRWPKSKKYKQFFLLFWLAVFLAIAGNWSAPVWLVLSEDLGCEISDLNNGVAFLFAFLALGCMCMQPTALKIGRRFVYVVCTFIMIVANIVGSQMTSVKHFWAVKILEGIAGAPCDSLVQISTTDVFFQHERASFLALFLFALYLGNYLGPSVSGYIVEKLSWRWSYYLQLIMFVSVWLAVIFYMEDTTFSRREDIGEVETQILQQIRSRETINEKDIGTVVVDEASSQEEEQVPLKTYWQKFKLIQTDYNDTRTWVHIWSMPFFLLALPSVVWGGVIYGAQMMWVSYMATTQATIFGLAPYNFSSGQIGLTSFAPLVGNLFGMLYGGKFVDWLTIKLAKRNNGVMEAEFRLYAMILPTIVNAGGIIAYGIGAEDKRPWPVLVVLGYGFMGFAMSSTGAICMTYAIDCYPKLASEAMVLILVIRNLIGMVFTFTFEYWLESCGMRLLGWLLFMISILLNGSFVVMILFGKKLRIKTFDQYKRISSPHFAGFSKAK